jgi:putative ATP-dependent endonuclease of the OLD family
MQLDKIKISNFRCFGEEPQTISLEHDLTILIGNNGSGKTALITALRRVFGSTREERAIVCDDFHIQPSETTENLEGRQLYIEVIFSFPELQGNIEAAKDTCPAFSSVIYADDKHALKARIRLEAVWSKNEYDDEVDSKLYWITTPHDVPFGDGEDSKFPVSASDRKHIRLRYIPAFRDSKATLGNEVKTLTRILKDYTALSKEIEDEIAALSKKLGDKVHTLQSLSTTVSLIKRIWEKAHDNTLAHYQEPILEATPSELGGLLKSISLKLAPSETGANKEINELSDGQISLLYFTLSLSLYELEQKHHKGELEGFSALDRDIPVFTIFAFEEPENHLSPYYLGRVLALLGTKCQTETATGIITSHCAGVVRRATRIEQIKHFRQDKTGGFSRSTIVSNITLPENKNSEDYKYISQAVLAHPELYFSKLVILGEGESEEIIIPQLASRLGFDLAPSFVAFVKLGGRHVNHMWRLLKNLEIPCATLLDLDWGRHGGGPRRIKYALDELQSIGANFTVPNGVTPESINVDSISDVTREQLLAILEEKMVFFSAPLDLDMTIIRAFPEYYDATGAHNSDRENLERAVLGKEGSATAYLNTSYSLSDEELKKYRYLFGTKSKVASHYKAMAEIVKLDDAIITQRCPESIKRLVKACAIVIQGET